MTVRLVLRRSTGALTARHWMFAQWFLLIAGILAVGYAALNVAARYVYQAYENRVFDDAVALRQAAPLSTKNSALDQARAVAMRSIVGKIDIPRLNISAIVKEGIGGRTLNLAAGHIPHTALPGQTGNVGICGAPRLPVSQFERCAARRQDYADHVRRRIRVSRDLSPDRSANGRFSP